MQENVTIRERRGGKISSKAVSTQGAVCFAPAVIIGPSTFMHEIIVVGPKEKTSRRAKGDQKFTHGSVTSRREIRLAIRTKI